MRGIDLRKIAKMMPGGSGAESKGVCTEAGMFALDQPLERPTLIKGLKVGRLSLGPKALVLQKPNSGCISIHGGLLPVATAQGVLRKSSFKSSYKE